MKYLIAIDQGTSSTRAMLYSLDGELIACSQYNLKQYYPKPDWVEHDPEEIWEHCKNAISDVIRGIDHQSILACGLTNQRETTLIWDKKSGRCLSNAIVWQDRRTQNFCASLAKYQDLIQSKTGLQPDAYFSASKLRWLLREVPEAASLAAKGQLAFGTVDSFLIWRLTAGRAHLTDITNASRTLLFNIHEQQWDADLLALFDIPVSVLPKVEACDFHFGSFDKSLFGFSVPITGVAGDQQAALVGQACFSRGMIKATYGTGGFLLLNTGKKPVASQHNLLTTIAYCIKDETSYGLEGSLYHAGTIVKWLRDSMGLIHSASETEELARSLHSNEGLYLIPSFSGLGAPHWWKSSGAIICGISQRTRPAHFARAALESVCYLTADVLACMQEDVGLDLSVLRVDGGMAVNNWFLEYMASICKMEVQRPVDIETTARGAASLALLGCGELTSLADLQKKWVFERQFRPQKSSHFEADYKAWTKALSQFSPNTKI